jgi:hypothetical protein
LQKTSMPGSLARPPNNEHRDREDREKLTGELAGELEEDKGGDTVSAATVVAAQRHRRVGYGGAEQHLAHGQAAKHSITPGETPGLQECLPTGKAVETQQQAPRRGEGTPTRSSQSRSSRRGEIDWATSGGDGDERRRDRQITTVRGESVRRQSKCPAWRRRRPLELAGIKR